MKLSPNIEGLKQFVQDPLYKNSLFLMLTSGTGALLGFVFWILVARFYPPDEVGLATALISAAGLLGVFSKLGFDFGLIRYLAGEGDKKGMVNTSFTVVGLFSLVIAMIFVAGLGFWSRDLLFLRDDIALFLLFILYTPMWSVYMLQSSVFVGMRSAKHSFIQNTITAILKMPLPLALVSFGVSGIFLSTGVAYFVALIASLFLLMPKLIPKYRPVPVIKRRVFNEMLYFSVGNYVADIFDALPGLLLPLLIINLSTHEMSAYFFIAWTTANVLFMLPVATSSSLLAEGAYDPQTLRRNVMRAVKFMLILLIPAVIGILILGSKLLLLFGREYSENGLQLLWLLALSSIPVAIIRVYLTIKRVQHKIRPIIAIYAFTAISTLAVSYSLITSVGLLGVGIAWICVQGITVAVVGWLVIKKEKWLYV